MILYSTQKKNHQKIIIAITIITATSKKIVLIILVYFTSTDNNNVSHFLPRHAHFPPAHFPLPLFHYQCHQNQDPKHFHYPHNGHLNIIITNVIANGRFWLTAITDNGISLCTENTPISTGRKTPFSKGWWRSILFICLLIERLWFSSVIFMLSVASLGSVYEH